MRAKLQAIARLSTIAIACVLSLGVGFSSVLDAVVSHVVTPAVDSRVALAADGRGASTTYEVSYRSEISSLGSADSSVSARVGFEDAWFIGDHASYNNDLARTCAALSAACNSQSRARMFDRGDAVVSLENLGFEDIDASSYEGRSLVADELLNIVEGETDVVAYVFAHRPLRDGRGGYAGELVLVGVRGTYGSEWISNFNVGAQVSHEGFSRASAEVEASLDAYLSRHHLDGGQVKLLLTGHSRGGAVANLVAARLIDRAYAGEASWSIEDVRAYTFASPNASACGERTASRYDSVFNVVNPADAVARVPLNSQGMGLFGATVELPDSSRDDSSTSFGLMQKNRALLTGCNIEGEQPSSSRALDALERSLDGLVSCAGSLGALLHAVDVVSATVQLDLLSTVVAHSPDTYLSWLSVVDPADLRFSAR